jgi:hypothetical protein
MALSMLSRNCASSADPTSVELTVAVAVLKLWAEMVASAPSAGYRRESLAVERIDDCDLRTGNGGALRVRDGAAQVAGRGQPGKCTCPGQKDCNR